MAIWQAVQEVKEEYKGTEFLQPSAVYRFFRAESDGNQLQHFRRPTDAKPDRHVRFPAPDAKRTDFAWPTTPGRSATPERANRATPSRSSSSRVGKGIRQLAENLKNRGDYLKCHIIQALALESAEAYAEMLHSQIRKGWGYPDAPEMTMMERFQAKYRGKRYSFGYPACPRLDDQALLWKLLNPRKSAFSSPTAS